MPAKKKPHKIEKNVERDLIKIGIFIGVLIVIFVVVGAYFKSLNHFDYQGLKFTKEKYGNLPIYHYYYYYTNTHGGIVQYNLYLQHDPRTNNISISGDKVNFERQGVYLTIDSSYPATCSENLAGITDLSLFLRRNELEILEGVMNESDRHTTKVPYITCQNRNQSDVIQMFGGNYTHVTINGNCTSIVIGPDCRIQEAVEKFKLQTILDARVN